MIRLDRSVPKRFRSGTHRSRSARETVEWIERLAPALGITRVANVTGLDFIGIPVVTVCRPNARSLSVSQGKGVTLDAAKASGLMEAVELFHAERIGAPLRFASYDELRLVSAVADVSRLPQPHGSPFHDHLRILWLESTDLISERSVWIPLELVHLDCTRPAPPGSGSFRSSSNGLASGNDRWEATIHAICEVLERDALSRFSALPPAEQDARRVDPTTIDDRSCRELLAQYEKAGVQVAVWDTTASTGVASILCGISVEADWAMDGSRLYYGMGCNPDRGIALSRGLTEAAQARLTMISGSRDDAVRKLYALAADPDRGADQRDWFDRAAPRRSFGAIPTWQNDDLAEDGRWLLGRMLDGGFEQVLGVDLTIPGLDIPVVFVAVPGAESMGGFEAPSDPSA
jgi:YcaO-like protein with predicted kinase domain